MEHRYTASTTAPLVPKDRTLEALREAARACRACPLWERGTQTVFGEGRANVPLMLVGEQPGDVEDQRGRPFVGPSGKLLDRVLAEIGIARFTEELAKVVHALRPGADS